MRTTRTPIAAAMALFLTGLLVAFTPGSAHAADIYRYWAYFTVTDGAFVAQGTGPSGANPADGSIEAYRYAAPADFANPNLPRADLSKVNFDTVCADVAAAEGKKRVAVLVDFGVEEDATDGASVPAAQAWCAQVDTDANGLQVLQSVSQKVRTEDSSYGPMLCAIESYPATGCGSDLAEAGTPADGEPVAFVMPGDEAASADEDDDSNLPLLIGVGAAVVVLGAGGAFLARRRSADEAA
ncbi:SCO2322 family protein [Nocardioides sp. AE5]|uniref:SCO2322 family protein n=1 Tax=Nocardioides sp. AE5 TaxID=2962573 RepID=UPI00288192C9|nr:SCO2322 family protein [Nocardioides sp. AE5]MDT0201764.1 SCO2322 family protein [Nocardioides sp. AE5]